MITQTRPRHSHDSIHRYLIISVHYRPTQADQFNSRIKIECSGYNVKVSQICIKIEFENEYPWKLFLLGHWYRKYKFFHSNPLFSSSPGFLTVLHLPSGDEKFFVDNPPLSYIKSCVLACRLQIWTSFLVLPRQNIE